MRDSTRARVIKSPLHRELLGREGEEVSLGPHDKRDGDATK